MKKRMCAFAFLILGIVFLLRAQDATQIGELSKRDIGQILGAWCAYKSPYGLPKVIWTYSWGNGINISNITTVIDWDKNKNKVLTILVPGLYQFPITRIEKQSKGIFKLLLELPKVFLEESKGFPAVVSLYLRFLDDSTVSFQEDPQVLYNYQIKDVRWYKLSGPNVRIPEKYKSAKSGDVFEEDIPNP